MNNQDIKIKTKVVVFCGGIGGTILGYENADMEVKIALDSDTTSLDVIKRNFPHIIIERLDEFTELSRFGNKIDILDITIPSRYLRNNAKRDAHQYVLFLQNVMRCIYVVKPALVVLNTEAQWTKGKNRLTLNEWHELLKQMGYAVAYETLKSSLYGVPNEKVWGISIGVRKDIGIKPVFPDATDQEVTTMEVIGDLLQEDSDVSVDEDRLDLVKKYFPSGCTVKEVRRIAKEEDLDVLPSLYRRDRWKQPYFALEGATTRPFHPTADRLMSVKEAKRLQGFPDHYELSVNPSYNWTEVCSSVSPLLAERVAETLQREILMYM